MTFPARLTPFLQKLYPNKPRGTCSFATLALFVRLLGARGAAKLFPLKETLAE